jgi:hypothetical protein
VTGLAVEIGLRHPQPLGRELVVARLGRRQDRINARLQQAGVRAVVGAPCLRTSPRPQLSLGPAPPGQGYGDRPSLHPIGQRGMARLAVEVCLRHPQPLGRQLVVGGLIGRQQRILARLQQAGVDRRFDRLERAAAGRQKQRAWQETERNRA